MLDPPRIRPASILAGLLKTNGFSLIECTGIRPLTKSLHNCKSLLINKMYAGTPFSVHCMSRLPRFFACNYNMATFSTRGSHLRGWLRPRWLPQMLYPLITAWFARPSNIHGKESSRKCLSKHAFDAIALASEYDYGHAKRPWSHCPFCRIPRPSDPSCKHADTLTNYLRFCAVGSHFSCFVIGFL